MVHGKPRFVAVDEWVPGYGNHPFFAQVQPDGDVFPLIIEKSYAKILGNYKRTENDLVFISLLI